MMICAKGLVLRVHLSAAGYFIGTFKSEEDDCYEPNCRISTYFKTEKQAEEALMAGNGYIVRSENQFCCPNCKGYPIADVNL